MRKEEAWIIKGTGERQYESQIPLTLWEAKRSLVMARFSRLGYGDPHWHNIEFVTKTPYTYGGRGGEAYRDAAELPKEIFDNDSSNR